mmetsp:Transcript_76203/g.204611  ORF Transcript_76203/g.204611 Transcript_76203/m.204611 type:complete len:304 (-) Transcript_76203:311-1222(-)
MGGVVCSFTADRNLNRALELQKKQYEFWLEKRTAELKKYISEFETYKAEKTRQMVELEGHAFYLLEYSNVLATLIANFERGLYPVYEKAGLKAVQIPEREKPGPMRAETMKDLAKYKRRADEYVKAHPGGVSVAFTEDNPTAQPDAAAVAAAVAAATADEDGEEDPGVDGLKVAQAELRDLRTKLAAAEALNASSIGRVRAELEREILAELSGQPAVELLRRTEDERTHYKEQLAEEVRRTRDLRIQLEAKQRLIDKANATLAAARLPPVGLGTTLGAAPVGAHLACILPAAQTDWRLPSRFR